MEFDRRLLNVIMLGVGFLLVFTAFQTLGNIEKTVLDSISADDPNFTGDAYVSLAVIYTLFALCNWITPSILTLIGVRLAMVLGTACYGLFTATFLFPSTALLYVASALVGLGSAVAWCSQGAYLSLNSDPNTVSRNAGLFWGIFQTSQFFGNLFVYFQFAGKTHIDADTRKIVFAVLVTVAFIGVAAIACLRPAPPPGSVADNSELGARAASEAAHHVAVVTAQPGPIEALRGAFRLLFTTRMLLLSITFLYTGLELTFCSGVYGPSIGFTLQLGENAKQLVGLSGIFLGVGEVLGGGLFGLLGSVTTKRGRDPIVIAGFLVHVLAFFLVFLNLPGDAPFGDTNQEAFITSNAYLAILCSFLIGFGDSCFNTQIYSLLAGVYAEDSAPAFALFKFTQSVAAAAGFFYSSHVGLYWQLAILLVFATLGTASFCYVEWRARKKALLEKVDEAITEKE